MTASARPPVAAEVLGRADAQLATAKSFGGSRLPLEAIRDKDGRSSPAWQQAPEPLVTPPGRGKIPLQIRHARIYEPYGLRRASSYPGSAPRQSGRRGKQPSPSKRLGDQLARPLGEVVAELEQVVAGDEHGGR